jgi:uncharacterized protein YndB with AHSA1/START domain
MPTARRSRTLAASAPDVWATVGDAHHLPRWWPRVQRVEAVTGEHFTQVLMTDKGKTVRADFRVLETRAPELRRWTQEVEGTPFERLLERSETEVRVMPDGAGARVELVLRQRLHGSARLGGLLVRRATARVLDEALDGLEALHGAG